MSPFISYKHILVNTKHSMLLLSGEQLMQCDQFMPVMQILFLSLSLLDLIGDLKAFYLAHQQKGKEKTSEQHEKP